MRNEQDGSELLLNGSYNPTAMLCFRTGSGTASLCCPPSHSQGDCRLAPPFLPLKFVSQGSNGDAVMALAGKID